MLPKKVHPKLLTLFDYTKRETFIISGVLVVGGTVAGTVGYIAHRKQRKLDMQFGLALQEYVDSARNGALNIDILDNLINSIEAIEKTNPRSLLTSIFLPLNSVT